MSRESILERNRKRAQENDQKMGATALGTSALNYSTQQSLERAAAEKVARESAGGLIDVSQPWLNTITTVTPSSRSASRWSGTTPSSRGGGFGETESQGEGYFTQSRQSPLERANNYAQGTAKGIAGAFGSGIGGLLDAADYAVREFVRTTFTLPDGVLEEKGLDTPEMREDIQRFNETMNRENPVVQGILDLSDQALNESAEQYARSKVGVGPLGSLAMDLGRVGVEMLTDAGIAAATGGSGLIPMAVRSFGAGSSQARREGASSQEAFLSGAAQGTIDAATERLFGIALPFARLYGGGSLDDVVQRGIQSAVSRFASTEAGQRALGGGLTVAASALTEGAEEFIADWASWQLPNIIYGGDVASVEETLSNSLYDFMLGSVMGGLGGVVSPSTYNYQLPSRQENAGGVVNSDTTTGMEAPESPGSAQDTAQNDNIPEATRRAVDLLASGQEITGGQAERIARSPEAVALLGQLTGSEINTDAPISQVKADIRAVAGTRAASGGVSSQGQASTQTERTAAQRVYDVNRVRGAAASTGMGESGRRAIAKAYDGSVDADRYYAGFTAYYEAGLSGRAQDQVRSDYAADLTEAQRFAAYAAGQNDAAASLQRERAGVNYATVYGDEAGFVPSEHSANLSQETTRFYNALAKATGTKITVTAATGESGANGWYRDGTIYISSDAQNAGEVVAMHEITHRLQEIAPEAYRKYRDYAVNALSEQAGSSAELVERYKSRYAASGVNLTTEEAMDEIAADFTEALTVDPSRFEALARDDRSVARKVLDAVRDFIRKVKRAISGRNRQNQAARETFGVDLDTLEQAARLWEDALRAGRETTLQAGARDGRMGTTRNSLKEDGNHGRTREEARGAFLRRAAGAGYAVYEGETAAYGFRRAGQPHDAGNYGEITQEAQDTQRELTALGVSADIVDGPILRNRNGVTEERAVTQAVTVDRSHIFISKDTTLSPRNIAGHEAFHLWKSGTGRDSYIEILEDNLLFSSEAFREYQTPIAEAYLGGEADLANDAQMDKMREEIFAYISGDIHEGTNEDTLRPMFRDFDAVRAAWEQLVEENRSTQARESRKGFSVDRELDREIRQIVKEAREGGRSEEAVQADIRALVQESYQRMAEQYGTIPAGERPAREARVPRRTAEDRVVSQTVRTVLEGGATPEAAIPNIEELTARGVFSYTRYTDKQAMEDAEGVIRDKGYATALSDWTSRVRSGEVSKANTAEGWALYNQAANSGDVKSAMTILTNMVEHQRNAAQAVQATRILKQLSPDAQLYGVERSVRNLQEELTRKYGKNAPDLKIDEELAGRFLSARTQKARDEAMQELYRDIGRQMPSRFVDKWNAWRYLAMLGNPRTHVRNVVGNAFFAPVVATKNLTATAIEAAAARVSRGRMGRSKRLVGFGKKDRALLSAAWADFANVEEQILGSGKYSDSANANRYIQEGRVIFRNKALETARRGNSAALDLEDTWFSKPHYAYALAQYAKANGLTAAQLRNGRGLDGARVYAIREAQKATYRDTNAFSQMISDLGRYQGSNPAKKAASVVLEGILPFRKTPANILVRGVEYSPLGLLKSLTYDLVQVRSGEKTAAEAIDGIAAGLTGTGLMALGVLLAAEGLVRGSGGGDDDENQYEELMGHQAYALEVGGQSYTLDWLAPESLPFFVGVNLWEQSGAEEEVPTLSTMINAIGNVTEPLLEMSCLQSLNEVFDAVGYATSEGLGALPSALVSAATSYLTQAVPTILGQAERTSQGERMTTYTEKNAFLTQDMQYTLGSISGRTPGWDYQQIPYIDAWGRTESTGSTAGRALDNFLNPAYRSAIEESPMELALQELYEQTGESAVLPSRAPRYFNVDGERKDLTAGEYVEYASARGQTAYVLMEELFQRTEGAGLSDEDMVNAVERVYEYANAQAKTQVSSYEPEGWVKKAMDGAASGVNPVDYTLYELAKEMADAENSDLEKRNGSIDQSEAEAAIDMLTGLSNEARAYLWQSTNKGWKESNNPYR